MRETRPYVKSADIRKEYTAVINNPKISRLAPLTEDPLSRELGTYQLSLLALGHFSAHAPSISNTSLPCHRIIYVTEGPIRYTIRDSVLTLEKGDVLYTPPNTIYSAGGMNDHVPPQFLYLYFHVLPLHREQNFIRLMETAGKIRVFHALRSPVEFYFHTIMEEYEKLRPGYYQKIHSYLMLLVMELLRQKGDYSASEQTSRINSPSSLILNKAVSYIAANIREPLRISQISHICGVSESYLYKIFLADLGLSPKEYILNCKMEYAVQLLKEQNMTVTQIARELGFSNPNHFSNSFYKVMGKRPTEYRSPSPSNISG